MILHNDKWPIRAFLTNLPRINLRPQYQREFIYNAEDQAKVIDSIMLGLPLNTIWLNELPNGNYEVIDGQQRLTSIDNFINKTASLIKMNNPQLNNLTWAGLATVDQEKILDYNLHIYIVSNQNPDPVKYDLFKRVNTVGTQLNAMELLNATYSGIFVNNLKKFCHDNDQKLRNVTAKTWLRAETEEIILKWFTDDLSWFLSENQDNKTLDFLKKSVKAINWMEAVTDKSLRAKIYNPTAIYYLYEKYQANTPDIEELKNVCDLLFNHPEIQNKKGILEYAFDYLLGNPEREELLNLKTFSADLKPLVAQVQEFKCNICKKDISHNRDYQLAELTHLVSWKDGGLTEKANAQLLCFECISK